MFIDEFHQLITARANSLTKQSSHRWHISTVLIILRESLQLQCMSSAFHH